MTLEARLAALAERFRTEVKALRSETVFGNGKPQVGMGLEPCNILSTSNIAQTTALLNAVRFLPIDVPPGCEWDRIQAWVASAEAGGAGVARTVGLYQSVDGTLPDVNGGLLKSGVLPAFTSTTSKQVVFDAPIKLKAGRYYLATHLTYTTAPTTFPQVMAANNASRLPLWLGDNPSNSNMRQSNNARVYMISNVSGLPNNLTNPTWQPTGDSLSMHMVLGRSA